MGRPLLDVNMLPTRAFVMLNHQQGTKGITCEYSDFFAKLFWEIFSLIGLKMVFFALNNGPKRAKNA